MTERSVNFIIIVEICRIWGGLVKGLRLIISLTTLIIAALSMPFSVFALDDSCVSQRGYFNKCDEKNIIQIDNDGLDASVKYIADSDEGCFYFNMKFVDDVMSDGDEIHFKFTISNALDSVSFDVDKGGIASYTSQNTRSKVNVIAKFMIVDVERGGDAIIGFELKDKEYRRQCNSISCIYYCGDKRSVTVLSAVELDMFVDEPTTAARSTNAKTTIPKTSKASKTKASQKGTTAQKQDETKFIPSRITGTQSTSKFAGNTTNQQSSSQTADNVQTQSDEEYWEQELAGIETNESYAAVTNSQLMKTSSLAKCILIFGIIAILAGVTVLIIGLVKKSTNQPDNSSESDSEK